MIRRNWLYNICRLGVSHNRNSHMNGLDKHICRLGGSQNRNSHMYVWVTGITTLHTWYWFQQNFYHSLHNSMDASQPASGDSNRHEHRRFLLTVTLEATIVTVWDFAPTRLTYMYKCTDEMGCKSDRWTWETLFPISIYCAQILVRECPRDHRCTLTMTL